MKLVDVNLLMYAVNEDSAHHVKAKAWLERTLSGDESVALPWVVVLAFLRLTTSSRVMPHPLTADQALAVVDGWLAQPPVLTLSPGGEHWRVLRGLIEEVGASGNLTTDAHLAAIAIENGAELCSSDTDFARFPRLRFSNPVA